MEEAQQDPPDPDTCRRRFTESKPPTDLSTDSIQPACIPCRDVGDHSGQPLWSWTSLTDSVTVARRLMDPTGLSVIGVYWLCTGVDPILTHRPRDSASTFTPSSEAIVRRPSHESRFCLHGALLPCISGMEMRRAEGKDCGPSVTQVLSARVLVIPWAWAQVRTRAAARNEARCGFGEVPGPLGPPPARSVHR